MKTKHLLLLINSMVILFSSCNLTVPHKRIKLHNETDSISYYLGLYTGIILKYAGYEEFNKAIFEKAIEEVYAKKYANINNYKEADSVIDSYIKKSIVIKNKIHFEEGQKFLSNNKKRKGISTTQTGLQYEILRKGNGIKPRINDTIIILYKGQTADGIEFVDMYTNGPDTLLFIGNTAGTKEGIQLMNAGSKYRFYIPSDLAYGENEYFGGLVKPYSVVIFDMELINVIPAKQYN